MSIFSKVLKGVGGVALGLGSGVVKTATGGMVDIQGAISGAKSSTSNNAPTQTAQGAEVVQPAQTGSPSWLQSVMDTIVGGVNSMNPKVTVSADQTQANTMLKYGLIAGAGLLVFTLMSNNRRS